MNMGELSGYIASLLVFAAFYMKSMVPLRLVAIASNLAFIGYALHGGLMPVLLLHGALLPLNIQRLLEVRRFRVEAGAAASRKTSWRWATAAVLRLLQRPLSLVANASGRGAP